MVYLGCGAPSSVGNSYETFSISSVPGIVLSF